ncbi:MAG: trimethylamine methyltransferase family protein [Peptostreptococcaceae bacterium]
MKKYDIKRNIKFEILTESDVNLVHEKSLELIETLGMRISGERVQNLLKNKGIEIDENDIAKIPRKFILEALETVPKELILYNRDGEPQIIINSENRVYWGTHSDQLEIVDPYTNKARWFKKEDTKTMCKIADYLPNIDFILSVGLSADVEPEVQSLVTFVETIKNFRKPINFSTNDVDTIQDIVDIAAIVAGGLDKLQEKPFIFNYCEPIPPLTHPFESTEKLYLSAINKIPTVYMPYCMMGGTSPMNFATTLVQCNAEILVGILITQVVNEGAPFIYGAMPSIFDMKTTIGSYAAPEFHLMVAAASEMANYYQLPFYGTGPCSDAKTVDMQSCSEVSYQVLSTMLSKANIVHDVGVLDHCNSVSPVMVVMANELINEYKHYTQGVEVNEKEIKLDLIEKVSYGGHHLNEKYTLKNFKKVWYPEFFSRKMKNDEESQIMDAMVAKIKDIVENHEVPQLNEEIVRKIDEYVDNKTAILS